MNALDIILLVILAVSVIAGLRSGFTRAAFGLVAAFLGVLLGFWFYETPAGWVKGVVGSEMIADLFGFLIVFLLVMVAGGILGRIAATAFKVVGLGPVDRLAGAAFGFVRGVFAVAALVAVLVSAMPRPVPSFMRSSAVLPYALGASDFLSGLAPSALKRAVGGSIAEIRESWNEEVQKAKQRAEKVFDGSDAKADKEAVKAEPKAEPKEIEIIPPKQKSKAKTKAKTKLPSAAPPKPVKQ